VAYKTDYSKKDYPIYWTHCTSFRHPLHFVRGFEPGEIRMSHLPDIKIIFGLIRMNINSDVIVVY
jgi:hypothetical protein